MAREFLQRLARFARRRYYAVFAATLAVVVLGLLLCSRLRLDTDVLNLLPRHDPVVRTFVETMEEFGGIDYLLVVVRVPPGVAVDPYQSFVDALGERLRLLPQLGHVDYRFGEPEELLRRFFPKAVLFLDDAGRQELERRLSDEGIRRRVAALRRQLSTPQAVALKRLALVDPLGLAEILLGRLAAGGGALNVDLASGYYLSRDHRLLLLIAKPVRPPQDIEFTAGLVTAVEAEVEAAAAEWAEIAGPPEPPGEELPPPPEVELGGGYLIALGDASLIKRDIVLNVVTSVGGVLLLFLLAFRRLAALGYAFLPLACGAVLTFAFAAVVFGTLSNATSGVAAVLFGLGIDFVIVTYGRYVEERNGGAGIEEGLARTAATAGWAVVVGAVTTTATFYAFGVTEFTGLRQMGLLVGTGILFCVAAVLLLLPAMFAWSEDHHRRRQREPTLYVHGFGAAPLLRLARRRPGPVLATAVALTLLAAGAATRIRFQENVQAMRPGGNRGVAVQEEVGRHFGSGLEVMTLMVSGESAEEVLELADRAAAGAARLVREEVLTGYDAVTSLVPPPQQQRSALAWLAERRRDAVDLERIRAAFRAAAAAEGLRTEPFAPGLDLLQTALTPTGPISLDDFRQSQDTLRLLERFVRQTPGGWRSAVYLYPPPRIWKRQPPPPAVVLADELGPQVVLSGANVVSARLRAKAKTDAFVAGALGIFLVVLLLWADYRRARSMLASLLPLAVGLVWMLGAMGALGIDMNFMNIFVTTMIIGIGTDYGVHVVHRWHELRDAGAQRLASGLGETANAVLLSALTTVVGFGSLSLSHYPGLRSMGLVAVLGVVFTCVAAIALLPALLTLWVRRRPPSAPPRPAPRESPPGGSGPPPSS
jgi:predicted RND superfamily exporter protein